MNVGFQALERSFCLLLSNIFAVADNNTSLNVKQKLFLSEVGKNFKSPQRLMQI